MYEQVVVEYDPKRGYRTNSLKGLPLIMGCKISNEEVLEIKFENEDNCDENCKFFRDGLCASPINGKELSCEVVPVEWCYYKQLQQKDDDIKQYSDWLDESREENKKLEALLVKVQERLNQVDCSDSLEVRALRADLHQILDSEVKPYDNMNQYKETLEKLHKPIAFLIMALEEVLKSQKDNFSTDAEYAIYLSCMKDEISKAFHKGCHE